MHNKCWVQGHLSVLITFLVLKRVDQEKQVTPKVEIFMKIQVIFKWYSFHMGEEWFSYWYSLSSPSL